MLLYCNGCHRRKIAQAKQDRTQAIYDKAKKFGGGEITDNWIKLMRWLEKELQGGAGGEWLLYCWLYPKGWDAKAIVITQDKRNAIDWLEIRLKELKQGAEDGMSKR